MDGPGRMLVAGVGNIFLSDDGFGSEVVRRLEGATWPVGVKVRDFGISGIHLAYMLLEGYDALVLVDTVARGATPGTLFVLEAGEPTGAGWGVEAHSMDPQAVLASVRTLGGHVPRTFVVGCEPEDVSEGLGLSPAVAGAVEAAVALVADVVRDELGEGVTAGA